MPLETQNPSPLALLPSLSQTHNICSETHNIYTRGVRESWVDSPEVTDAIESFSVNTDEQIELRIPRDVIQALNKSGITGKRRDTVIHFCSRILKEGRKRNDGVGVPMNAQVMRQAYAERSPETVKLAKKLGLVKMVGNYSSGYRSRLFCFTDQVDVRNTTLTEIHNKGLIGRLKSWKHVKIIRSIKKHGAPFDRLLVDLCALRLSDRGIKDLEQFIEDKEPNAGALPSILTRFISGRGGWFSVKENLRLATHVTGLPSAIRSELMIEGEPMVELDINCSHVAQLVNLFSPAQCKEPEYQEIINLIRSRHFYEQFKAAWENNPDGTKSEKILFQKLINDQRPTRAELPMWIELKQRFPILASVLVSLKKSHRFKGDVANYIQGCEAKLIQEVALKLQSLGIKCYTVFDSVGVPSSRKEQSELIFNAVLEARLGFSLPVKLSSN